ncbi:MAG: AraC family ligand binding domain-containing protein, partial [Spirochaetales bacterium]|nr:AraC family ligand binding domain-containing protein [Spirochaetales bacterium]
MDNIDQNMSDIDFLPDEPPFFSIQVNSSKRFFHPPEDDDSGSMQVVAGGCEHCIQGYSVDRSDFPFYAFEFLASGAGTLILDGKHFQLTPGTCFFYGPGITHTITNIGAGMLVKYFADFSPSGAYPVLMENLGLQNKVVHVPIPGSIVHTIEDLIDTGRKRSHFSRQICSRLAELVIYKIADCAYESKDIYTSSYKSYRRCKGIIEKHFLDIWTLKDISE